MISLVLISQYVHFMIFLTHLRSTQLQVKCILSKDMPTHKKYDPNIFETKFEPSINKTFKCHEVYGF